MKWPNKLPAWSICDLGVIRDAKIGFLDPITTLCKEFNKSMGFIIREST